MYMSNKVISLLGLKNKTEILLAEKTRIKKLNGEKVFSYSIFTSDEYLLFDYHIRKKMITVNERIEYGNIEKIELIERDLKKYLFTVTAQFTHKPTLKISTKDGVKEFILFDVIFDLKSKIDKFIVAVNNKNNNVVISLNYFNHKTKVKKYEAYMLVVLIIIVIIFAIFQIFRLFSS